MEDGKLGRLYRDKEVIIRQGEVGDLMYIIQSGRARVSCLDGGKEVEIGELKDNDFFGEMAIIDRETRSATVTASGDVYVLSVDKKTFLRRVHEDPSLAYRILQQHTRIIRDLNKDLARLKAQTPAD